MSKQALLLFFASSSFFGCRFTERRLEKDFKGLPMPVIQTQTCTLSGEKDSYKLRYLELANEDAPVLVFIHGTPGALQNFIGFFKDSLLREDFHLLSVDRLGFGSSERGLYVPLEKQSQAIATLLEPYAQRTVILVGHSYGGTVALQMAVNFPTLIDGLVLLAPAADPHYEEPRWYNYIGSMGMVQSVVPAPMRVSNKELLALKTELERMDPFLSDLKLPVYHIHGTGDMFASFKTTYYTRKKLSDLTVHVLEDVNHFIPWTHPEDVKKGIYALRERLVP